MIDIDEKKIIFQVVGKTTRKKIFMMHMIIIVIFLMYYETQRCQYLLTYDSKLYDEKSMN